MAIRSNARIITAVTGAAVVAAAAAAAVFTLSSPGHSPQAAPSPTTVPTPVTSVNPHAPAMPAHGAYLGAYVQGSGYSQPDQVAALHAFQKQIGKRLQIVHSYLRWQGRFPTESQDVAMRQGSILLLSWTGTDAQAVAAGTYDRIIRQRALAMKATHHRIFLEWRWEMNRDAMQSLVHSPRDYIRAWDHVRAIFNRAKVRNVAWVWCPSSKGWGNVPGYLPGPEFYPGNNEVDWICADVYPRLGGYSPFGSIVRPFLAWASHIHKPIMFGEVGAPQSYSPRQRVEWLQGMARTILADRQIKALVYFDGGQPGQPAAFQTGLDPGSAALRAFREIAHHPPFASADPARPSA
jgi:hypothetical protein